MKGTGRIQRFTTSLPGVARACPDLPGFARICLGAIHAFVMVENDFKWEIKMFLGSFNGFYHLFHWPMLPGGALSQWDCSIFWSLISWEPVDRFDDLLHGNKGSWKELDGYNDLCSGYLGLPRHEKFQLQIFKKFSLEGLKILKVENV